MGSVCVLCSTRLPFPSRWLPLCLTLTIISVAAASPLMGAGLQGDLLTQVLKKGTNFSGYGGISFWPNEDGAFIIEMQLGFPFSKHLGHNDSLCLALSLV